jgi:hypothetical protein
MGEEFLLLVYIVDVFGDHLRARRPCVFNHHITLYYNHTSEVIPKLSTQVTGDEVIGYPQLGILLGYLIVFHFFPYLCKWQIFVPPVVLVRQLTQTLARVC